MKKWKIISIEVYEAVVEAETAAEAKRIMWEDPAQGDNKRLIRHMVRTARKKRPKKYTPYGV